MTNFHLSFHSHSGLKYIIIYNLIKLRNGIVFCFFSSMYFVFRIKDQKAILMTFFLSPQGKNKI